MMILLLTSDEGHLKSWCPSSDVSRRVIIVIVNIAYISNLNVNESGLRNFAPCF